MYFFWFLISVNINTIIDTSKTLFFCRMDNNMTKIHEIPNVQLQVDLFLTDYGCFDDSNKTILLDEKYTKQFTPAQERIPTKNLIIFFGIITVLMFSYTVINLLDPTDI